MPINGNKFRLNQLTSSLLLFKQKSQKAFICELATALAWSSWQFSFFFRSFDLLWALLDQSCMTTASKSFRTTWKCSSRAETGRVSRSPESWSSIGPKVSTLIAFWGGWVWETTWRLLVWSKEASSYLKGCPSTTFWSCTTFTTGWVVSISWREFWANFFLTF